jgi:hypothetical protein
MTLHPASPGKLAMPLGDNQPFPVGAGCACPTPFPIGGAPEANRQPGHPNNAAANAE